jgi:hypothetical protein
MTDLELYFSHPMFTCFDGEESGEPAPTGEESDDNPIPKDKKSFTQEEVNAFLSKDRKKHKEQYTKLETQLQATLQGGLTPEQRATLEESLENVRKQLRSKEEQAKVEKKNLEDAYTKQLTEWEARAKKAESDLYESNLRRTLLDAAHAGDAFNPEQIVTLLRPYVKDTDGGTMIDFPDVNSDTGEQQISQMNPADTMKRMKQLDQWANLFKSNVVAGVGGSSATGNLKPGQDGRVDPRKLSTAEYMRLRKENPKALGL